MPTTANTAATGLLLCVASLYAVAVDAATASYTLEDVVLQDGTQMTGTFTWFYPAGDFENGVGQFTELDVPHTTHDHTDLDANIDVAQSIEITLPGSVHDDGVDITLFLETPLTPASSSALDLVRSKYEIGGNGFHDGVFLSGRIDPVADTDADGVGDNQDNCTNAANADQRDTNADGIGNACDADITNDCSVTFGDLALLKAAFIPNPYVGDADFDGDGFVNFADLALMKSTFFNGANPGPGPSGLPNACN